MSVQTTTPPAQTQVAAPPANTSPTAPPAGFMGLWRVSKSYDGATPVLADYTLPLAPGGVTVLMGTSGGGKTTMLRMLLGLERPDTGTVAGLEGLRLSAVFREDRLCENLSAMANVCLPHGRLHRPERAHLWTRVENALAQVGLGGCADKPVHSLSGGMKRRVALLRAALADFDLIAFDEPLKGLDEATKRTTMESLLPHLAGKTVVWVTHDRDDLGFFENPQVVEL